MIYKTLFMRLPWITVDSPKPARDLAPPSTPTDSKNQQKQR
jgi:hypothetical protein